MAAASVAVYAPALPWPRIRPLRLEGAKSNDAAVKDAAQQRLARALKALLLRQPLPPGHRQDVCGHAEDMSKLCGEQPLIQLVELTLTGHVRDRLLGVEKGWTLIGSSAHVEDESAMAHAKLQELLAFWRDFRAALQEICKVFNVLDHRQEAFRAGSSDSATGLDCDRASPSASLAASSGTLWSLGIACFRKCLEQQQEVLRMVVLWLVELIDRTRHDCTYHHEHIHPAKRRRKMSVIPSVVDQLVELGLYETYLEVEVLKQASDRYHQEAMDMVTDPEVSIPRYLTHCQQKLREERGRCMEYLQPSTAEKLASVVHKALVGNHASRILSWDFQNFLMQGSLADLNVLVQSFDATGQTSLLLSSFGAAVESAATAVLASHGDDGNQLDVIGNLLQLRAKLQHTVEIAFGNAQVFCKLLFDGLSRAITCAHHEPRVASLLAAHINLLLQHDESLEQERHLCKQLDGVVDIFKMLSCKETFEAQFASDLAKRMLHHRDDAGRLKSSHAHAEALVIGRFRKEFGASFLPNFDGMTEDLELSTVLQAAYACENTAGDANSQENLDFKVTVLTKKLWDPAGPVEDAIIYPQPILRLQERYRNFYTSQCVSQHKARRLRWSATLGQCTLRVRFQSGYKELIMSVSQALVLLTFNSRDVSSLALLQRETGIDEEHLELVLHSLLRPRSKMPALLLKQDEPAMGISITAGAGGKIGPNYSVNEHFHHARPSLVVPSPQSCPGDEHGGSTRRLEQSALCERQAVMSALLVRTMKRHQTLSWDELFQEATDKLPFTVQTAEVASCIESLVQRGYIMKSGGDSMTDITDSIDTADVDMSNSMLRYIA